MCEAMTRAIKKAGSKTELARQIGVSVPAVLYWERGKVPVGRVLEIERLTPEITNS